MNNLFLTFSLFLLLNATVFLFIGLNAIIKNKPSVINARWPLVIFFFSLVPIIIDIITVLSSVGGLFGLINFIIPILIICAAFIEMRGCRIYCANDIDLRDAVIFSLNDASIKFEEKLHRIELIELNNELDIAFTSWDYGGKIKFKINKDEIIFTKIIDGIKQFFKGKNIKTKKALATFYLIFSILLIILGATCAMPYYK